LNSWTDPLDLNAGWLTGLVDLNTEKDFVQERIAAYLTDLIGIGFSGFRVDAAKHMQPADLALIFSTVRVFRQKFILEVPLSFTPLIRLKRAGV
jgi:alpha-amylase